MSRLLAVICTGLALSGLPAAAQEEVPDPSLARPFQSEALGTSFRPEIPEAERLAGLALIWSEAKYNFANFDLVPDLDWDARYLDFIPRVQAAGTTLDYYRVLMEFVAGLKDGHSSISPPQELGDQFWGRPPLYTRLLEDKVIVYLVDSKRLRAKGIVDGVEILEIDGRPVHEYVAKHVKPYQAASTAQDLEVRCYTYGLLRGPRERPVRLTIESANGVVSRHEVPRAGYADSDEVVSYPGDFSWRMLDGEVAHIDIRSFNDVKVLESFVEAYPELRQAKGWIFDVRKNGGGNSGNGWGMLTHIVDEPLQVSAWRTRLYRPVYRAWNRDDAWVWEAHAIDSREPADGPHYDGPVMVLSSGRTYSAAEDFLVAFRQAKRGLIIGQASGGSTGQPMRFALPGGGSARICSKRDTFADGTDFVGIGVKPDIEVRPTVEDIRAGRDPVLDRAVREIKESLLPAD